MHVIPGFNAGKTCWKRSQTSLATRNVEKLAIAGYLALCTFIDKKIGLILDALEQTGLVDNTIVVYSSDHGDNLGARGLWGKSNVYRESAAVPMIVAGPDVPQGEINYTAVNLTDLHATFLDAHGLPDVDDDFERPGESLLQLLGSSDQNQNNAQSVSRRRFTNRRVYGC